MCTILHFLVFRTKQSELNSATVPDRPLSRTDGDNDLLTLNIRKGESSPNIPRLHPTETVRSLGALPTSLTMPSRLGAGDCYSSTEYVQYTERQCDDEGASRFSRKIEFSSFL
ncbi:hypothetical protein Q1695_011987 [Nippostrongylus brasiliensis]|nr:hypothetical protein Q1695_011987 [Nippostrongylus brasiliensis]